MKELKSKISLTLDTSIIERIRVLSEEDDRSLSQYVNLILRDYLRKLDGKENSDIQGK